jgi:asparagine synthase (glutamine-hydrolysing)
MISDVPVGCYLSGGLDSSIITALARPADSWSVGFADHNEFAWAAMAAQKAGAAHHDVMIDEASFLSVARDMILKRREPLSVPNAVLLYALSREARPKNKVLLCGEGADELFFGYDRIFRWAAGQQTFDLAAFDRHYSYGKEPDPEILEDALAPFVKTYNRPIDIVAAFFQIAHLHGLLRRLDNSSMLASVEARAPFVDYRLVEAMAGVRFDYRMKDGVVKAPLKRIFGQLLPPEIVTRAKVGFPVPLARLFHCPEAEAFEAWTSFNLETLGLRTA